MPIEKLRPSFTFDEDRLKELKKVVPEAFADGKINWEVLKEALGEHVEDETGEIEHFGLFWPGKFDARKIASIPSKGTLMPIYGEGLMADGTPDTDGENDSQNIFIEGENLEVLKLLQKSYAGRIKMIYIDPPYNTGNDFIYDDDFTEPLQEYLKRTGQIDEEGKPLTTNKKADGRFHSKWLSMMYPRLRLARNLLKNDGVLFVSIDENEFTNLKSIINEIFGEENFVASIIWQKVFSPKNTAMFFSEDHEYIIVVAKNKDIWKPQLLPRTDENINRYKNPDNDSRGPWMSGAIQARNYYSKGEYEVISPSGKAFSNPKGTYWRVSRDKFDVMNKDNRIWWGEMGNNVPRIKRFLSEVKLGVVPQTLWTYKEVGHTQEAKEELLKYVSFENTENVLNSVKPTRLIDKILQIGTREDEENIVLDFFAGSGPTAVSVLKRNSKNKLNTKYLLVQFPETLPTPEEKVKKIGDLARSRIINFIKEINDSSIDLGYKFLTLSKSNFKNWKNLDEKNIDNLEKLFEKFENPLVHNWNTVNLLYEIILLEGFPLDSKIEIDSKNNSNQIRIVSSGFYEHKLFICLDEEINDKITETFNLGEKDIFICLDTAISDQSKLMMSDKGLIKTI